MRIISILLFLFCVSINLSAKIDQEQINLLLQELSTIKEDTAKVALYLELLDCYEDNSVDRLTYAQQGLDLAAKLGWEEGIAKCSYKIGWYYIFSPFERDKAFDAFHKTIQHSRDDRLIINTYGIISNLYSWKGENILALESAQKGVDIISEKTSLDVEGNAWVYLGDACRYDGKMERAEQCYTTAYSLLIKHDPQDYSMSRAAVLLHLIKETKSVDVLNFSLKMKELYDNASPEGKQLQTISLFKMAEGYVLLMESERKKERQRWIYFTGLTLLAIMTIVLYWQNRTKKKTNSRLLTLNNELDQANKVKVRLLGILNHDLRQPVARLINYLQIRKRAPEAINPQLASQMEQQTMDMAENLLADMEELLIWCKDQMDTFEPTLKPILVATLFDNMKLSFNNDDRITFSVTPSDLSFTTDEDYMKIIIRNLTSNAIRAQQNDRTIKVEWSAKEEADRVILSISDNGRGIVQDKVDLFNKGEFETSVKYGLGLQIIKDLSKKIDCQVELFSKEYGGTTIKLFFKNK